MAGYSNRRPLGLVLSYAFSDLSDLSGDFFEAVPAALFDSGFLDSEFDVGFDLFA
jgi:hypothetical protein